MTRKRCSRCNKTKDVSEFSKNVKAKDGLASSCKLCAKGYHEEWRKDPKNLEVMRKRAVAHYRQDPIRKRKATATSQTAAKLKAMAYLGSSCPCGENHPAVCQFHHRDPSTKLFNLTTKILILTKKYPWDMIEAELDKCDLLCGNCHAKHHSVLTNLDSQWVVDDNKIKEFA
jgi:hypothetical protein